MGRGNRRGSYRGKWWQTVVSQLSRRSSTSMAFQNGKKWKGQDGNQKPVGLWYKLLSRAMIHNLYVKLLNGNFSMTQPFQGHVHIVVSRDFPGKISYLKNVILTRATKLFSVQYTKAPCTFHPCNVILIRAGTCVSRTELITHNSKGFRKLAVLLAMILNVISYFVSRMEKLWFTLQQKKRTTKSWNAWARLDLTLMPKTR